MLPLRGGISLSALTFHSAKHSGAGEVKTDNKPLILSAAQLRLNDGGGSTKRQKRTAMSDFSPLCHSLPQIKNANGTHHSFFDQRKRTESETKFFFFLSSLFVLSMKTKKYFLSLSLYAHLNKYLRCCILGKVRPLQIVTTPRSLS